MIMDSLDWIDFNVTHSLVPSSEESAELTSSYDASNSEVFEDNGPIRKRPKIDADKLEESDIEVQEGGGKKNTKILETEGEETEIKDKEVQSLGDDGWSDIQSSEDEQESDVHGSEEKGTSSVQDTPDKQNSEEKGSPSVQDSSEDEQEPDVHGSEEKGSSSVQDTPDKQSSEEKGSPSVQDSSEDEQEPDVHGSEEESVQDTPKKSSEEKGSSSVQDSSEDEQESDVHGSEEKSVQDTAIQSSEEKGSSSVQDSSEDEQESDIHGSEEKSVQDTPKQSSEEKGSSCVQDSSEDEQESDVHGLEEKGLSSVQDTPDKQELDIQGSEDSQEYDLQVPEKTQESEIDSDQDVDDDHGVEDLPIFQRLMNLASGEATGSLKSIVKDWLEMYIADRKTAEQQFVELILQCIGCHKPFTWSDWKTSPLSLLIVVMQKRTGASESFFQKNSKEYDVNFQEIFGQLIQCLQHEIFRNRNIFVCTGVQTFLFNIAVRFGNITGPLTFRIIGAHFVLNWYAAILKIISDLNKKKTNQLHRMKKMKENPKLKHAYIEHKKQIKEIVKGQDEIKILADRLAKFILDPAVEIQLMYLKHWQTLVQHHPDLMCSPREFDCIVYHVAHPDTTIRSFALKVKLKYQIFIDDCHRANTKFNC
ncbi:hypothetical protein B566_EDAN004081 [Ephemera danica]|nr:hypothetical protein B566_EDAN004081 [Ephemera danica]